MPLPKVEGTKVRGSTYYSNIRVPPPLKDRYPSKSHIVRSLETSDPKIAKRKITSLVASLIDEEIELNRAANIDEAIKSLPADQRRIVEDAGGIEGLIGEFEASKKALAFAHVGESDYDTDVPTPSRDLRVEEAQDRAVHGVLLDEAVQEAKTLRAVGLNVQVPGNKVTGLRELAMEYIEAHGTPRVSHRSYLTPVRRFIELHGDIPLEDLRMEHLRIFADELKKLTPSRKDGVHKLAFRENAKAAKVQNLRLMTDQARRKSIDHLKYLTAWAPSQGYLSADPFSGFKLTTARGKFSDQKKPRLPFSGAEAQTMLEYVRSNRHPQSVDYWGPLIMAYQGARREETAQIRVCDVCQIDGEWVMRITDEGEDGKVKNHSSLRNLPIHPKVKEAGFLDFVQARQAAPEDYLFREETRKGSGVLKNLELDADERLSGAWGKRFNNQDMKAAGVKKDGLVLYSFRHTWETAAEHAEINDKHRRALAGRASEPVVFMTGEGYGSV